MTKHSIDNCPNCNKKLPKRGDQWAYGRGGSVWFLCSERCMKQWKASREVENELNNFFAKLW